MSPWQYLRRFALVAMLASLIVIAVNMIIDPLGISPIRILLKRVNMEKPLRIGYDRLVKPRDVAREQPATIFFGSSRVKQTFDPRGLDGTAFAPAYNQGCDNLANLGIIYTLFRSEASSDQKLRHVFIEIFLTADLSQGNPILAVLPGDALGDWRNVNFSLTALGYSLQTILANMQAPNPPSMAWMGGYAPIRLDATHFSVRNIPNEVLWLKTSTPQDRLTDQAINALAGIMALCRERGIDCRFVITPLHASALYGMYQLGLWPEVNRLKRVLASLAPTYDFTRYNALIDESTGPVLYWPEAFHYSPALGALVTDVLAGRANPVIPANFGELLVSAKIDEQLKAWTGERDHWISTHAEVVEQHRLALKNFQAGKTFEEVTNDNIRKGGY